MKELYKSLGISEEVYVYFDRIDEKTVRVFLESKEAVTDEELMIRGKQFSNELLVQKVRYGVSKQTKNVRELILGRALYSTCIETNEESEKSEDSIDEMEDIDMQADENISLDDIAVSWFEQYAGEEGHE